MRQWLRFVGIDVAGEIAVAPTLAAPEQLALTRERSLELARELAAQL
ncbi:hypothetical protein [Andreprevotia sp. IGB-42]|nr:hypothetical protein [Andreprevotia sp. IGB-42]